MQPNFVFVADGAELFQIVKRANASGAQRGDHVTWYQPSSDVFSNGFGQYEPGHPTTLVRLEHPHRHRSQETGFLHARIGLIYIYIGAASTRTVLLKKKLIIVIDRSCIDSTQDIFIIITIAPDIISTPLNFLIIHVDSITDSYVIQDRNQGVFSDQTQPIFFLNIIYYML